VGHGIRNPSCEESEKPLDTHRS
jgi:hypothetical protein